MDSPELRRVELDEWSVADVIDLAKRRLDRGDRDPEYWAAVRQRPH